jgi:membrane-bound metal-dependent hydrolase YbcI (DUF457 family)
MDPLGHASIALIAKPLVPKAPLWALIGACEIPDILYFGFQAAGIENSGATSVDFTHGLRELVLPNLPWSHGLTMSLVWSLAVAALAYAFLRERRASLAIGLMVFSHWVLDAIVYPIMPIFFTQSPMTGLGLMTSAPGFIASIFLEVGLIAGGIAFYWIKRRKIA